MCRQVTGHQALQGGQRHILGLQPVQQISQFSGQGGGLGWINAAAASYQVQQQKLPAQGRDRRRQGEHVVAVQGIQ